MKQLITVLDENLNPIEMEMEDRESAEWYNKGIHQVLEAPELYGLEKKKEQETWKPTEEQLEALECAIASFREDECYTIAGNLKELYEQLKKR